jgi:peptidyl-prolyl cis-trans isomerase SurA
LLKKAEIEKIRQEALEQMIATKLINQEAEKLDIKIDERVVEDTMKDMRVANSLEREEFETMITQDGLSWDAYREQVHAELKKMKVINYIIESKVRVSDEEIDEVLVERGGSPEAVEEVALKQILLPVPAKSSKEEVQQIRQRGLALLERIKQGEDFGTLADQSSQDPAAGAGGDLGYFKKGDLIPPLEKAIAGLKVNEVTSLVRSPMGFHILKVVDRREKRSTLSEEEKRKIRRELFQRKVDQRYSEWLSELMKKSFVDRRL